MQHSDNHCSGFVMPHRRLLVYCKALELLAAVRAAQVADAKLRWDGSGREALNVMLTQCRRIEHARIEHLAQIEQELGPTANTLVRRWCQYRTPVVVAASTRTFVSIS